MSEEEGADMNCAVIYNPNARNSKKLTADEISNFFKTHHSDINLQIYITKAKGDGISRASAAIENGADMIYAAGGDGTLNEVLSGIMQTKKNGQPLKTPVLCPIPLGTVNVFSKETGYSQNPSEALRQTLQDTAYEKFIDIGACNDRFFIMMLSIGIDGFIVEQMEQMIAKKSCFKKFLGQTAYVIIGLKSFLKYKFRKLSVNAVSAFGKKKFTCDFALINNSKFYGGRYVFNPDTEIDDGYLSLLMLNSKGITDYFKFFYHILTQNYNFNGIDVIRHKIKSCEINYFDNAGEKHDSTVLKLHPDSTGNCYKAYSQIDGENYHEPPLKIKVIEKAVKIIIPN